MQLEELLELTELASVSGVRGSDAYLVTPAGCPPSRGRFTSPLTPERAVSIGVTPVSPRLIARAAGRASRRIPNAVGIRPSQL
jgi:hypothetical protein